jgi:hypothetical protein
MNVNVSVTMNVIVTVNVTINVIVTVNVTMTREGYSDCET